MPRTALQRQAADAQGRRGETYAAAWLERRGWAIVARRVRTKAGEVDLVARRPGLVAFVEVAFTHVELSRVKSWTDGECVRGSPDDRRNHLRAVQQG